MKNNLTLSLGTQFLSSKGLSSFFSQSFSPNSLRKNKIDKPMLNARRTTNKLIVHFFSAINGLASKPVFTFKHHSVIVHVFYYIPITGQAINNNTVNNLGDILSTLLKRPVELRFVKLHYPYLNSDILAQYIASNTQNYKLVQIVRRVFSLVAPVNHNSSEGLAIALPAHITGIKVRVSGRLVTERSRPRQTVQTAEIGSFSKNNLSLVDSALYTTKNKKGAFTVKVWISQRAII